MTNTAAAIMIIMEVAPYYQFLIYQKSCFIFHRSHMPHQSSCYNYFYLEFTRQLGYLPYIWFLFSKGIWL